MGKEVPQALCETPDSACSKMLSHFRLVCLTDFRLPAVGALDVVSSMIDQRLRRKYEILQPPRQLKQEIMKRLPVVEIAKLMLSLQLVVQPDESIQFTKVLLKGI